jgi:hypothetical protein
MFDKVIKIVIEKRKKERRETALYTINNTDNDGSNVLLPARAQTLGPITLLLQ